HRAAIPHLDRYAARPVRANGRGPRERLVGRQTNGRITACLCRLRSRGPRPANGLLRLDEIRCLTRRFECVAMIEHPAKVPAHRIASPDCCEIALRGPVLPRAGGCAGIAVTAHIYRMRLPPHRSSGILL